MKTYMHRTLRDLWTMKRNPIDWSCVSGVLVDTSALHLTKQQKYDIGIENEKLESKTLRKRNLRRAYNPLQRRTNNRIY